MLGIGAKHELPAVLLIDDDLVSREVIATVLTLHGQSVQTAATGEEAIAILAEARFLPEVILMDAQIPGLSGIELIEKLRKLSPAGIYVISGSKPAADLLAAADGFLQKPFTPDDLIREIRQHEPQLQTPAASVEYPVISSETLAQFRQIMPEPAVREIYMAVISDLKKRMVALDDAITAGDSDQVRRLGHAIKGGCGMAGALQISQLGAILEAKSDQLDNCSITLRELYSASVSLERMLGKEFPA